MSVLDLGFIGDSITAGANGNPVAAAAAYLLGNGYTNVNATNEGVSGSTSGDWISGSTNLNAALTAFAASSVHVVHVMLGTNDAKTAVDTSPSQYLTNLTSLTGALVSAGYKVILSKPIWTVPNADGGMWIADPGTLYGQFFTNALTLVDGVNIFQGDSSAFTYSETNAGTFLASDGVHPADTTANDTLGGLWGAAILNDFPPPESLMAYSLVSHTHTTGGVTGGSSPAINTVGATLLVFSVSYLVNNPVVSDSLGNTFTLAVDSGTNAGNQGKRIYYCLNPITGASDIFTIGTSGGNVLAVGEITAWSGAAASSVLGPTNSALAPTATTLQPGSVTPTQNGSLIITGVTSQNTGSVTINSGFTITDQEPLTGGVSYSGAQAYLIQGTAGAVNPTWSGLTLTSAAAIAVFKPAAVNTAGMFFGAD